MKIKLDGNAFEPIRAHKTDAGMDLLSPIDIAVRGGESAIVDTVDGGERGDDGFGSTGK